MNEEELQKLFRETLRACRKWHGLDTEFTNAVKEFYNLSDKQMEKLLDHDGIVDPMQYATGKITWREFKGYVKKVSKLQGIGLK